MRNAEMDTEENYNNIDGVRNNIKPQKDESKGKASILDSLKANKAAIAEQGKDATKSDQDVKKNHGHER